MIFCMKKIVVVIGVMVVSSFSAFCQVSAGDKMALEIPVASTNSTHSISAYAMSHYTSDSDRIRALFVWVANNIDYDVAKLTQPPPTTPPLPADVLTTRKALCQGYADLFITLCHECNIPAIFVGGYTKFSTGTVSDLAHAWVAAPIGERWFLFDPTWAAGTVENNRFTRSYSDRYYKVPPEQMIKDHMPFDPMYQFLNFPVRYDAFNNNLPEIAGAKKIYFNYADTIAQYNKLDSLGRLISFANRINSNGEKNRLVNEALRILNKNQNAGQSKVGFENAVAKFNLATNIYNRYVFNKNQRFAAIKNDEEIFQMVDSIHLMIKSIYPILEKVNPETPENRQALQTLQTALTQFYYRVEAEDEFLKGYLKRDKTSR